MATTRRLFGIKDDVTAGGSSYDDIVQSFGGVVPDADTFYPVTGGTLEKNIERIERNDEVRGRRGATRPRSFRAAPVITVPFPTYRQSVEKFLRKVTGGTDVPVGTAPAPVVHPLVPLGYGSTALPAIHTQLTRDDVNHKMSGGSVNRVNLSFPLDGEGSGEAEIQGLFVDHYNGSIPTPSFSGLSEDVMMLRDAQAYLDGGTFVNEVQSIAITGTPTGGNIVVGYGGQQATIAYNASSANVATALQALNNIGASGVTTGGGPLPAAAVTVTFTNQLADPDQIIVLQNNLTGGTNPQATVTTTTPSEGTPIPDLQGFEFSFTNNVNRKWYAKRNVMTRFLGAALNVYKLWYPEENKLGAAQDVTYRLSFGNPSVAQEIAFDFAQVQRLVFEVTGALLSTTPKAYELLRITIYNAVHTGGGPDALSARDDIASSYEGGGFYSEADGADIKVEVVNNSATPIT